MHRMITPLVLIALSALGLWLMDAEPARTLAQLLGAALGFVVPVAVGAWLERLEIWLAAFFGVPSGIVLAERVFGYRAALESARWTEDLPMVFAGGGSIGIILVLVTSAYIEGPGTAMHMKVSGRYAAAGVVAFPLTAVALYTAGLRLL